MVLLERGKSFLRVRQGRQERHQPFDARLIVIDAPPQGGKLLMLGYEQFLSRPEKSEIKHYIQHHQGGAGNLESANDGSVTAAGHLFPRFLACPDQIVRGASDVLKRGRGSRLLKPFVDDGHIPKVGRVLEVTQKSFDGFFALT